MKAKRLVSLGLGAAMMFSMPFGVLAGSGDVPVSGSITLTDPTSGSGEGGYEVTIPSKVYWYVNNNSRPNIVNGKIGGADTDVWGKPGTTENEIKNNTSLAIDVTFNSFALVGGNTGDAYVIKDDLDLFFAGDLDVIDADLAGGYSTLTPIGKLDGGDSLKFGFKGKFTGTIDDTTNYEPVYTMTLGFTLSTPSPR